MLFRFQKESGYKTPGVKISTRAEQQRKSWPLREQVPPGTAVLVDARQTSAPRSDGMQNACCIKRIALPAMQAAR